MQIVWSHRKHIVLPFTDSLSATAWMACAIALGISCVAAAQPQSQSAHVRGKEPAVENSVIRRHAPAILLPSSASPEHSKPPLSQSAPEDVHYADVVLRGAIGHVPAGEGQCTIEKGRVHTTVNYHKGLPHTIVRTDGGVRKTRTKLTWNANKVLLEGSARTVYTRTSSKDAPWKVYKWRVMQRRWDHLTRPKTVQTTASEGAANTHVECTWKNPREGTCAWRGNLRAEVRLTPGGEITSVRWLDNDEDMRKGTLTAIWRGHLLTRFERDHGSSDTQERYQYDGAGRLRRIERRSRTLHGIQTLRWSLQRGARGNVVRITRRCSGACAGERREIQVQMTYSKGLDHTFCGAWWDDGLTPRLHWPSQ